MKIGVIKEILPGENRVAITPETTKKLIGLGCSVHVEAGAGAASSYTDGAYTAAGATIARSSEDILKAVDALFVVQLPPEPAQQEHLLTLKKGALLLGLLSPLAHATFLTKLATKGVIAFALENIPRITRAQSMDVLSSQSNLGGYRAVIEGMTLLNRAMPMMMTAAGSIKPAKVVVLGAGVAGLQAIATAKRMGAKVYAFDVRPAVKEQVQSLGATFVEVDGLKEESQAETQGGYAKEMDDDFKQRQQDKIAETLKDADLVITTALIPGKPAPVLVPETAVSTMKSGSVIIDMAVGAGGNCPLSKPGITPTSNGVIIGGYGNLPSHVAFDASALYARNLFNFFDLLWNKESRTMAPNWDDAIVEATCVARPV